MGRMYSVVFEQVSVTVAQDLFEINAPSDAIVVVHSVEITQSSDTDSEQLNILVHRGSTSGSGGSTPTPSPLEASDAAFGGTAETNNTSQSTEGTQIYSACFNVLNGFFWCPTPECRPVIPPSGRLIVELQTAPGDVLTMSGSMLIEEIG
jgi:hypothetical protein